jgi:hypothetical protein
MSAVVIINLFTQEVPEYVPKKKYMWTTVVDFFKQRQKFGRHPFVITPNI